MVLNAFISGLNDASIRQRLLESDDLTVEQAHDKARVFELAKKNSDKYTTGYGASVSATDGPGLTPNHQDYYPQEIVQQHNNTEDRAQSFSYRQQSAAIRSGNYKKKKYSCYFCGKENCKQRSTCPALREECRHCHIVGHFEKVCLKKKQEEGNKGKSAAVSYYRPIMASAGESFCKTVLKTALTDNTIIEALFDTGSTICVLYLKHVSSVWHFM